MIRAIFIAFAFLALMFTSSASIAEPAKPWQMGLQDAATEIMEKIHESHHFVMINMMAILAFVTVLLIYVIVRFRRKGNDPIVKKNHKSHNVALEVAWTVIPLLLVAVLTVQNVKLIRYQNHIPKTELTIKAIGYQWYWGYRYPEFQDVAFESYIKPSSDLKPGELRLLEVDKRVVVPVNTNIRLQTTSADVIHSWAVPALGVKIDAVPGRLNETWFNIKKPGTYYGQCSEFCGNLHGFMPIVVVAVTKEEFYKWLQSQKV